MQTRQQNSYMNLRTVLLLTAFWSVLDQICQCTLNFCFNRGHSGFFCTKQLEQNMLHINWSPLYLYLRVTGVIKWFGKVFSGDTAPPNGEEQEQAERKGEKGRWRRERRRGEKHGSEKKKIQTSFLENCRNRHNFSSTWHFGKENRTACEEHAQPRVSFTGWCLPKHYISYRRDNFTYTKAWKWMFLKWWGDSSLLCAEM